MSTKTLMSLDSSVKGSCKPLFCSSTMIVIIKKYTLSFSNVQLTYARFIQLVLVTYFL